MFTLKQHVRNDQIVPYAQASTPEEPIAAYSHTESFSTSPDFASTCGHMPLSLFFLYRERAPHITQVILSYDTPLAWRDGSTWVIPDITYSATTSTRHATHLHRLSNVITIPTDCGTEEYHRYLLGFMHYTGKGTAPGPGPRQS